MICESCGYEALALKTVRWRNAAVKRKFPLCDQCYEPLSGSLWIVAGHHTVNARCDSCGDYVSLDEMAVLVGGAGKRDFGGACKDCVR